MKDLSLFLLKNSLASRMRKGFRNFCNGSGSTSTLNQKPGRDVSCIAAPSVVGSYSEDHNNMTASPLTLEQMILQLDMEEEVARRGKFDEYGEFNRRMSCVNNYDILTSARNALNQYPRFSLDGKDAMYRASFRNFEGRRKSVCTSSTNVIGRRCRNAREMDAERGHRLPATVAGESVDWCKPGIVAKLMGLDAVPIPIRRSRNKGNTQFSNRNQYARRLGKHELQKERLCMGLYGYDGCKTSRESTGSCSTSGYCVMNPVSVEQGCGNADWQFSRPR